MDSFETVALTTPITSRAAEPARPAEPALVVDLTGFDEFYRREHEGMVRLAFLMCGDRETATEVTHDAFVVTYERWRRLDRPGAYLRTSVVNRCRDLGRRRRFSSAGPVPERASVDSTDAELADAIAALPAKRRAAVVLRYYADLSEADIAEALGVRPGTVKSLLSRGLAELRAAWTPDEERPVTDTEGTP